MRYESMVIVDPIKGKAETDRVSQDLQQLIEKCGGSNIDVEDYGERKLAYRVKKFKRGYYYLIHFDMEGTQIPMFRRELKLNEEVFRYLIMQDEDEGLERRDLSKPTTFNADAVGRKSRFDKKGEGSRDGESFGESRVKPYSAKVDSPQEESKKPEVEVE